ncbi:MAG: hypothetical protein J6Z08_04875 [Elusimicrobiales bacterium]|nr:hypothetical protein [Elusimicrobiales bacterium]
MSKKTTILGFVVIFLAIGAYVKYHNAGEKKTEAAVQQPVQETSENSDIIITDEGVGLSEEAKNSLEKEITDDGYRPDAYNETATSEEAYEDITITGPNKLPMEKCVKKYLSHHTEVARYLANLRYTDMTKDYSYCHAVAENNPGFCDYSSNSCFYQTREYKFYYDVMTNKRYDMNVCLESFQNAKVPNWSTEKLCEGTVSVLKGKQQPPAQFAAHFRFMSGRPSACANTISMDKYSCVLLADMVSGIKTGISNYYLYSALKYNDCKRTDKAMVEAYCANRLVPNKPSGKDKKSKNRNRQ